MAPTTSVSATVCNIDVANYNYSLHRAALAACSQVSGVKVAQSLIVGFAGATFWICFELFGQLVFRFQKWRCMYFWSIAVSVWGTVIITISHVLNHYSDTPRIALALESVGWIGMVTGFALVLYSRLNILIENRKLLRTCLIIILVNGIIFHPLVIVGASLHTPQAATLLRVANHLEGFFALQEVCLAGLYVFYFIRFAKGMLNEPITKGLLRRLIFAEAVVFSTDLTLLSLLFAEVYVPREVIHPFCYAIKLKLEFIILNLLVEYSQARQRMISLGSVESQGIEQRLNDDLAPMGEISPVETEARVEVHNQKQG